MTWSAHFLCLFLALILDALVGDPSWLWRKLPHPVVVIGWAIDGLDRHFNDASASDTFPRVAGAAAITSLLVVAGATGAVIHLLLLKVPFGIFFEAVVAAVFIAQKSLAEHVRAVANGLEDGGLAGGRTAVSMIVGRDPESLDEAGVSEGGDREPCREFFGRHRGAGPVVCAPRPAGTVRLQDPQYGRLR